jgi:hypothetical protein
MIIICFQHETQVPETLLSHANNERDEFENHGSNGLKHMVEEDRGFVGVNLHSNKG